MDRDFPSKTRQQEPKITLSEQSRRILPHCDPESGDSGSHSVMKRSSIFCPALLGVVGMLGCSAGEAPPDGSVRGELRIANLSFDDGHSEREFYLAAPGTEGLTRLVFPKTPELSAHTNLKVWGGIEAENLLVERYEIDPTANEDEPGKIREPLLNGMKETRTVGFMTRAPSSRRQDGAGPAHVDVRLVEVVLAVAAMTSDEVTIARPMIG